MGEAIRLYTPAALAWAFVAARLVTRRWRKARAGAGAIWLIMIGLACSLTATTPAPYRLISEITGVPNLARLVSHVFMLLAAWGAQTLMLRLNNSGRAYRHVWWLVSVVVVMGVLFALADTPIDDVRFAGRYGRQPFVMEYWLVFVAGLMPAFLNVIRLCWRYGGLSGTFIGKLGLRLVAVGVASSVLYHVHKGLFFAAKRFDLFYPWRIGSHFDRLLPLVSAVLVLVGVTIPAWAPRIGLSALIDWFGRLRTYHRLRPLWFALYQASPQIALVPPRPAMLELLLPNDLDLRLYRRVIEIRDGRLALQPYLDPRVGVAARNQANGVTGRKLDAIVEATTLAAAVAAKRSGAPAREAEQIPVPGGRDLESDTAFLIDVARAYRKVRVPELVSEPVAG